MSKLLHIGRRRHYGVYFGSVMAMAGGFRTLDMC